jgi:glycosyltransferase involved in cell wall biosynthesis
MRSELGLTQEDFVFMFVGRIVMDKGINEMVTAFDRLSREYSHIHLVLVGAEETEQNPITEHSRCTINGNGHIHAIGRRSDVRPYLKDADAFVFPSYREGFGMVLIEANAMGTPAISSDIIGCNEIIIEGENGVLIPSKDADSLYIKMKEWLENPVSVKKMSAVCRKSIVQRFNRAEVWKLYLDEYLRLCENGGRGL